MKRMLVNSVGIGGQVGHLTVNGPANDVLMWDAIDWRSPADNVRRLRQRIFTAVRAGDLGTLRNLQVPDCPWACLSCLR